MDRDQQAACCQPTFGVLVGQRLSQTRNPSPAVPRDWLLPWQGPSRAQATDDCEGPLSANVGLVLRTLNRIIDGHLEGGASLG